MGVSGDFSKLSNLVGQLRRGGPQVRPLAARAFAQDLVFRTDRCFTSSTSPYGEAWASLKHRSGMPLMDTGRLKNSISAAARTDGVTISSNVDYAAIHNYGGGHIPRRQYLPDEARGLPESYRKDLERSAEAAMRAVFGEGAT